MTIGCDVPWLTRRLVRTLRGHGAGRSASGRAARFCYRPRRVDPQSNRSGHGRSFPVQEHHAPQGAPGCRPGAAFTKLLREVIVAAQAGLPDPALNPRLRSAIQAATAANMPKDKIERAIKRGAGRRGRELRRGPLRGLRARRRGADRRGADRQPQPHGERGARRLQQVTAGRWARPTASASSSTGSARSAIRPTSPSADAMLEAAIEAGAADCESRATTATRSPARRTI